MPIPAHGEMMRPLLEYLRDGLPRINYEYRDAMAQHFAITEDERAELQPSGNLKFDNRVEWVRFHLKREGFVESVGRGKIRITAKGHEALAGRIPLVSPHIGASGQNLGTQSTPLTEGTYVNKREAVSISQQDTADTPSELLEASYLQLRQALTEELLDQVKKVAPSFFERLVVDLLVAMGYGGNRIDAGEAIGRSGDGGIDGRIKEDKLGLDFIYVQAKRWEGAVGAPAVRDFAGSLEGHRARKGVLLTTSEFTREAKDYVERIEKRIVLVDGLHLANLMIDHGVGVTRVATFHVNRIDAEYFGDQ